MGWLKPLLSLFSVIAGWFRDKQLLDAGKEAAQGEAAQQTLDKVADANKPATPDELQHVRDTYRRD